MWTVGMLGVVLLGMPAQASELPGIPGIDDGGLSIKSTGTFLAFVGLGLGSGAVDLWLSPDDTINLAQVQTGYFGLEDGGIWMLNAGLEKRVAPWFGHAIELNMQQWSQGDEGSIGGGLVSYGRWLVPLKAPVRPMIEGGSGLFFSADPFPADGTKFTFNLSTRLGLEIDVSDAYRMRVLYGHVHHSNNGIVLPNPGIEAHGLTLALAREL